VARSVGRTDGRRGSQNAPEITTGLHRQVSLKLAGIVREGAATMVQPFDLGSP
jgi:hypothetical protein